MPYDTSVGAENPLEIDTDVDTVIFSPSMSVRSINSLEEIDYKKNEKCMVATLTTEFLIRAVFVSFESIWGDICGIFWIPVYA